MNNIKNISLCFAIVLLISACGKTKDDSTDTAKQKNIKSSVPTKLVITTVVQKVVEEIAETPAPEKIKKIPDPVLTSNVIAFINGSPVDINEFNQVFANRSLEKLPSYLRREYDKNRVNFIKQLINNKVFSCAASDESFDNSSDFIKERDDAVQQIKMKYYYDKNITSKVNISDAQVKKYYNDNVDKYTTPERIQVRHILVNVKKDAYPAEVSNAWQKIKTLRQRAKEGESFAEIAAVESDCPSRAKGGDLGYRQRGQLVPEFEKVAFSLKKNEISDIVETEFGYHTIQLMDKILSRPMPFDEVKEDIRRDLSTEKETALYYELLTSLTNKYKVIKNEKVIQQLSGEL